MVRLLRKVSRPVKLRDLLVDAMKADTEETEGLQAGSNDADNNFYAELDNLSKAVVGQWVQHDQYPEGIFNPLIEFTVADILSLKLTQHPKLCSPEDEDVNRQRRPDTRHLQYV